MRERARITRWFVRVGARVRKKWRREYGHERDNNPIIKGKIAYLVEAATDSIWLAYQKYGVIDDKIRGENWRALPAEEKRFLVRNGLNILETYFNER